MAKGEKTKMLWKNPEFRQKMAEAQKKVDRKGQNNPFWKGDAVGYHGIHIWIRKQRGRPSYCEHCQKTDEAAKYQWANKSGQYKRDVNDWLRLCLSCHKKYDLTEKQSNRIIGRSNTIKLVGSWYV